MYTTISIFKSDCYKVENHPNKIGVSIDSSNSLDSLFFANDMLATLEQAVATIKQNLAEIEARKQDGKK